ncbi:MAG: universal stress protein [Acidimicrobiia bacterium]|jgi:nucleotide-binding universal stress UspA family protein
MPERLVVGVDGSAGGERALRFAVDEARIRGARLDAVLAWGLLDQLGAPGEESFDPHFGEARAREYLAEAVRRAAGDGPEIEIELHVVCDLPARALLERAAGADLLIVGTRGLGGFRGLLLGSVSQQVAHHSPCPVVIVPPEGSR